MMKPFAQKPVAQQKKEYIAAVRREWMHARMDVLDHYRDDIEKSRLLRVKVATIAEKIALAEDRVANAADREFGGWDKWRHDPTLLARVVNRMDEATASLRQKSDEYRGKSESVILPYHSELDELAAKYAALIRTVER